MAELILSIRAPGSSANVVIASSGGRLVGAFASRLPLRIMAGPIRVTEMASSFRWPPCPCKWKKSRRPVSDNAAVPCRNGRAPLGRLPVRFSRRAPRR